MSLRTLVLEGALDLSLVACAVSLVAVSWQMVRVRRRYPDLWRFYGWPRLPYWISRDPGDRPRDHLFRDIALGRVEAVRGDRLLRAIAIVSQLSVLLLVVGLLAALAADLLLR